MDPSGAYPGVEMKGWRRHVVCEKPDIALILDEVRSAPGAEIEARFHSQCRIAQKNDYVLLRGEKGMMALIPAVEGGFRFREGSHPVLPVKEDASFGWIPYTGVVCGATREWTVLANIAVPVADEREAEKAASSAIIKEEAGETRVGFTVNGKRYEWAFVHKDGGLVLK
jgi:hypothetical protein